MYSKVGLLVQLYIFNKSGKRNTEKCENFNLEVLRQKSTKTSIVEWLKNITFTSLSGAQVKYPITSFIEAGITILGSSTGQKIPVQRIRYS